MHMNAKDAKHNLQFLRQMENTSNFSILDYLNCHIVHCVSAIIDSWIVNVVFGYCILLRTSRGRNPMEGVTPLSNPLSNPLEYSLK